MFNPNSHFHRTYSRTTLLVASYHQVCDLTVLRFSLLMGKYVCTCVTLSPSSLIWYRCNLGSKWQVLQCTGPVSRTLGCVHWWLKDLRKWWTPPIKTYCGSQELYLLNLIVLAGLLNAYESGLCVAGAWWECWSLGHVQNIWQEQVDHSRWLHMKAGI